MRGFPLLNVFLVIAFFTIAWWPLRMTVAEHQDATTAVALEAVKLASDSTAEHETDSAVLRVVTTRPLQAIRIEHLGEVIYAATDVSHPEIELPGFSVPEEGLDLWVEALVAESDDGSRAALGIELETSSGDQLQETLWSEGNTFSDSIYLQPTY